MYNFCFSGNPIFENKKGADEPIKIVSSDV